jgi:hypothetical protein
MSNRYLLLCAFTCLLVALSTNAAVAQSLTSGDITGSVTDPSGAAISNAEVTLKNNATGATQTHTTNDQGTYRFSLLSPGAYTVSVSASNFQVSQQTASVAVGQTTTLNVQVQLASATQTVEVNASGEVVQTDNADLTTSFSAEQIAAVPNPGNDLSYIVQTSPGAVMNTQGGYGNSATFGLPATSNLFTVDGMDENDPFLNLNNSGATNLLLGQNDIDQATVVNNGYSGEYGNLAGANVNYVTKSGSDKWHGNALYWWNGRTMNANNYFNNQTGTPRPFDNANQWAASLGGPVRKDKTFFFVNTEGVRVLLPTSTKVNIPSPQFQAATLIHLLPQPASIPFYQSLFSLWNDAPGAKTAKDVLAPGKTAGANPTPTGDGCGTFAGLGSAAIPCALQFQSTTGNQTNEWLLTARVDQNFGNNDRAFVHFRTDHGLQATYTDPISPVFNGLSKQPQYEGQLQETHSFGSTAVNQAIVSGSWYSAVFTTNSLSAATALIPFRLGFSGNSFSSLGADLNLWPQGRNVTQYGIIDDFSKVKGNHALKVGINFHRNDVTDYSPGIGTIGYSQGEDLSSFYNGQGVSYAQNFSLRATQPVAVYGLGFYGQDEWSARPNLKITLALRGDHNSNPVCQTNCFARLGTDFLNIPHNANTPYNQTIHTGLHQALGTYTKVSWQPRVGFAWSPFSSAGPVIRGGFGLFTDMFPATIADYLLNNAPLNNLFITGAGALSPGQFGNQAFLASRANASFLTGFSAGETLGQIQAQDPLFVPPSFYNAAHRIIAPQYEEWNLQVEQPLGARSSVALNYVGNHGVHEASQNAGLNAYDPTKFGDLPLSPTDTRFGTITEVSTPAVSNYNGLSLTARRQFNSLQVQANYTWSHAMDEVSNAGFLPYALLTNISVLSPQDPYNLRRYNLGNADYDTRHYFSLNYVWNTPYWKGPKAVMSGWVFSGTIFARSGLPFTVVDGNETGTLSANNYGGNLSGVGAFVFANYLGGAPSSCGSTAVKTPCLTNAMFTAASTGFGIQRRNQFYGPKYFDTDFTVMKNFRVPHWEAARLGVGAQFFNLFNHPNFDQPVGDISNPNFGQIIRTVNTPTSILGSFLGGDASPRLIQFKGSLTF